MTLHFSISGCDGTGKSTAIRYFLLINKHKYFWSRYSHFTQKIINGIGRIIGKSYDIKIEKGIVVHNIHNYKGIFGILYFTASIIDNYGYFLFWFLPNIILRKRPLIFDRSIPDRVADLIVDGVPQKLVLLSYLPMFFFAKRYVRFLVFTCSIDTIISRCPDLAGDPQLDEKLRAFDVVADFYYLRTIDTSSVKKDEMIFLIQNG